VPVLHGHFDKLAILPEGVGVEPDEFDFVHSPGLHLFRKDIHHPRDLALDRVVLVGIFVTLDYADAPFPIHYEIQPSALLVALAAELDGKFALVAEAGRVEEAGQALFFAFLALLASGCVNGLNVVFQGAAMSKGQVALLAGKGAFTGMGANVSCQCAP
jgi:hypothetical protein